jgi:phosphoglucomutase
MAVLPAEFCGTPVRNVITVDGTKLMLDDGSWLLFRKSGTEPVVRLYVEASDDERLTALVDAGRRFILS